MQTKADWRKIEQEYIVEGKSIMKLAREHGVSPTTVANYAKRGEWQNKRLAYRAQLEEAQYAKTVERFAADRDAILGEAVNVTRAALRKYLADVMAGRVVVTSRDAVAFVELLVKEIAPAVDPTTRATIIEGIGLAKDDVDLLHQVVDIARTHVKRVGATPNPEPANPRPD